MISVVTFLWGTKYVFDDVNRLRAQLARRLRIPHQLFCVTNKPQGINREVATVYPWPDFKELGGCYTRLKLLAPEMADRFGPRILMMDLDMVFTDDVTPLFDTREPVTVYKCKARGKHKFALCPGILLMDTGALAHVWDAFRADPYGEVGRAHLAGWSGTDQGIIGHHCNGRVATIGERDGVLSFRDDFKLAGREELPRGTRIVSFHSKTNPRDAAGRYPWIAPNWRT